MSCVCAPKKYKNWMMKLNEILQKLEEHYKMLVVLSSKSETDLMLSVCIQTVWSVKVKFLNLKFKKKRLELRRLSYGSQNIFRFCLLLVMI